MDQWGTPLTFSNIRKIQRIVVAGDIGPILKGNRAMESKPKVPSVLIQWSDLFDKGCPRQSLWLIRHLIWIPKGNTRSALSGSWERSWCAHTFIDICKRYDWGNDQCIIPTWTLCSGVSQWQSVTSTRFPTTPESRFNHTPVTSIPLPVRMIMREIFCEEMTDIKKWKLFPL